MEMSEKGTNTYGAGDGDPSAGGSQGAQAGPEASLSNDCNAMLVDHLANMADNASRERSKAAMSGGDDMTSTQEQRSTDGNIRTEEGGEQAAFQRSSLLNRTPPRRTQSLDGRERTTKDTEDFMDNGRGDKELGGKEISTLRHPVKLSTSNTVVKEQVLTSKQADTQKPSKTPEVNRPRPNKKRKWDLSPRATETIEDERKILWGRMKKKVQELYSIVKANPKTRTDIKRCSEDLQSLVVILDQLEVENIQLAIKPLTSPTGKESNPEDVAEPAKEDSLAQSENEVFDSEDNNADGECSQGEEESSKKGTGRQAMEQGGHPWTQYHSRKGARRDSKKHGDTARIKKPNSSSMQQHKQDGRPPEEKKTLTKKRQPKKSTQKNSLGKPRPEAILVKPKEGKTFADVLRSMRERTTPEDCDAKVKSVRKTKNGEILVELDKGTKDQEKFSETLKTALGEEATVLSISKKISLEIRDMDDMTTVEEVTLALNKALKKGENLPEIHKISVLGPNARGLKLAIIEIKDLHARELLKMERLKIGWVNCRIRIRPTVKQCYRCLGYGHVAKGCQKEEKKNCCYKCGLEGHLSKNCSNNPRCLACAGLKLGEDQLGHVMGSGKCTTFRKALDEARLALKR